MVLIKNIIAGLISLGSLSYTGLSHPIKYNYEVDPLGGRPVHDHTLPEKDNFAPPSLSSPLYSGTVVTFPSHIQIFWDYPRFVSDSLVVSVLQNGKTISSCNITQQEVFYEYVKVNWLPGCGVQTPGAYNLKLEARRRSDGQVESNTLNLNVIEKDPRPWPLENDEGGWPPTEPNLAGNLMENYQSFGGAASAYWHEGLDIRSTVKAGERYAGELHSPVSGEVVQLVRYSTSDLYWSLMVRERRGLIWQFHHLDRDTIPWKIGDKVNAGDVLGRIAYWPSSYNGALYHHVHMNVAIPQPGWAKIPEPYVDGWQYLNGLLMLDNGKFTGGLKPTSDGIMYFFNNTGTTAFAATSGTTTPTISGQVDIVINLHSEFQPTNSVPGHPYLNGLYEVGYTVEPIDKKLKKSGVGFIPELPLIRADKTPNEWSYNVPNFLTRDSDTMLRRVYKQSFSYNGRRLTSVFTYAERQLYYIVTNINRGEPDETGGYWDTNQVIPETGERRFPNGFYTVTVYCQDVFGNRLEIPRTVQVRN